MLTKRQHTLRILATVLGITGGAWELLLTVFLLLIRSGILPDMAPQFSIAWVWAHLIAALSGFAGGALSIKRPAHGGNVMFGSGLALLFFWAVFSSITDLLGPYLQSFLFFSSGAILLVVSGGMAVTATKARTETGAST